MKGYDPFEERRAKTLRRHLITLAFTHACLLSYSLAAQQRLLLILAVSLLVFWLLLLFKMRKGPR
jgi:uncharacterized membrane protein YccC